MHNEVKMSVPKELELGLGKQHTMVFPDMGLLHPKPQPPASCTEDTSRKKKPLNTFQWQL